MQDTNLPSIGDIGGMTNESLVELPLSAFASLYDDIAATIKNLQAAKAIIDSVIQSKYATAIENQYGEKGEQTGSIRIFEDDHVLKMDRPKRPEWNNEALAQIGIQLDLGGKDASEFITTKRTVSESKFQNLPSDYVALFEPARTLKVGKTSIKIEPIKE